MLAPFPFFPGSEPVEPSKTQDAPAQSLVSIAMLIKPRRPNRAEADEPAPERPAPPPRH